MNTSIAATIATLKNLLYSFTVLIKAETNPPKYELSKNPQELLDRLKEISTVFNHDGTLNGASKHAEEYALCLLEEARLAKNDRERCNKLNAKALELFNLITADEKDLLWISDSPKNGFFISEEVAGQPRKLGYDGLYNYAKLLLEKNPEKTKRLLLEIVNKIPTVCHPIHLQDVRVDSINILIKLGMLQIGTIPIEKILRDAKNHQY